MQVCAFFSRAGKSVDCSAEAGEGVGAVLFWVGLCRGTIRQADEWKETEKGSGVEIGSV